MMRRPTRTEGVLVPRLHRPADVLAPGEFLYFGAVRRRSVEQLLDRHIDPQWPGKKVADPLVAVTHQAKRLADIGWAKHRWLRASFAAAVSGAVFTAAGVLIGGAR